MKANRLVISMVFTAAAAMARASGPPAPCCTPGAKDAAPEAVISNRSVYQLGATWSDDAGKPTTLASLQGGAVLLAMFFTNCEYACPMVVGEMKRIQEGLPVALRARTRLVLVSFDSDRDSPATLRLYRGRMGLGDDWVLLHGQSDDVRELAMVLGVKFAKDSRGQFAHSNLITVLNPEGEIAFQRAGLTGDISAAIKALTVAAQ